MASRRNVVFDMGNVLMTFDGHEFARAFVGCEEDARTLYEGTFGRVEWSLLDSGTIDHQTMLRVALAHTPERLHASVRECLARWPEHSRVIEPTNDLALRLHEAGWGVYVLSNASDRIEEQLSRTPVFGVLDGIVVSGRERLMKPDPGHLPAALQPLRPRPRHVRLRGRQRRQLRGRPRGRHGRVPLHRRHCRAGSVSRRIGVGSVGAGRFSPAAPFSPGCRERLI